MDIPHPDDFNEVYLYEGEWSSVRALAQRRGGEVT